jgi:hypothetical protein
MKLRLILLLATLCLLAAAASAQNIKTLGYNLSNNQVVFGPTNTNAQLTFSNPIAFSAPTVATATRSNLGLVGTGSNSVIGGGVGNTATGTNAAVVGGISNSATFVNAFAGGGSNNLASGSRSFVGSGAGNQATAINSVVVGGRQNVSSGVASFVGGGEANVASGSVACVTVGGIENTNTADYGTIIGGYLAEVTADYGVALGGSRNKARGEFSMAGGRRANATNNGAFVWADNENVEFYSTNNDSFNIRARGGLSMDLGTNGIIFRTNASAAATRTNLGLGGGLITNVVAGTNTLVFSNGILTGVNP